MSEEATENLPLDTEVAANPELSEGANIFHLVNLLYRAASRLQYTLLHNQDIDFDNPEANTDEMIDNLREANVRVDIAIKAVNIAEQIS